MIIKGDAAQLEWRTKVFLAQDPVGMAEIAAGGDLHTDNKVKFGLPDRTSAKIFIYRAIYADAFGEQGYNGPAFAYVGDPLFAAVSSKVAFWEDVMAKFFEKYVFIKEHSLNLIREATTTGQITSPSGRVYLYQPYANYKGQLDWPRTKILNYIVQGLGADFMIEQRRELFRALNSLSGIGSRALLINTAHDDVELDVDNDPELCYNISIEVEKSFAAIPELFEESYGVKVNVPMAGEVKIGTTLYESEMFKFNRHTFQEDWDNYVRKCKENQNQQGH
jgi:hypothetical protein